MTSEVPKAKWSEDLPLLTAHILRRVEEDPGKVRCEISEDPSDYQSGEEGAIILASIPLISQSEDEDTSFPLVYGPLRLLCPTSGSMIDPWLALEFLVQRAFERGMEFERSQVGKPLEERADHTVWEG